MKFSDKEKYLKNRVHGIADAIQIMDHKLGKVMEHPVSSEKLTKIKEELESVIFDLNENINLIKKYWENDEKYKLRDELLKYQNFDVFFENHGWKEEYIKVRFHHSCDLLLILKDNKISYKCMCLSEKGDIIDISELSKLLDKYSKHSCIPWG